MDSDDALFFNSSIPVIADILVQYNFVAVVSSGNISLSSISSFLSCFQEVFSDHRSKKGFFSLI